MTSLDEKKVKQIREWTDSPFPPEVRKEAEKALKNYQDQIPTEDVEYFTAELKFGTGGLRGVIGNGVGRMNIWTVGKATLGFCRYLLKNHKSPAIVIAHDTRRMSPEFARAAAGIAVKNGFRVFLFDRPTPTPLLSFAIRHLKAQGGIVITASHNPPEYNGFKAYLDDGGQLVGPPQIEIENAIDSVADWNEIQFPDAEGPLMKEKISYIGEDILKAYIDKFKNLFFINPVDHPSKKKIKIVYSPLHGTGGFWLTELLSAFGFTVIPVKEQFEGDGEFPTVKYPNPEEPEALRLAEKTAREHDADIFLATDPDADRLGAGLRSEKGKYTLINGNQIGSLMCAYLCEKMASTKASGSGDKNKRYHVIKTIVTSDLQKAITEKNGFAIHNVLTGFKYIAEQMRLMENGDATHDYQAGRDHYLFGGEESFGYLPIDFVRDKDSLASALLFCEMLVEKNNLLSYLDEIYLKYGLYLEELRSVTLKGAAGQKQIESIIANLRKRRPEELNPGSRKITDILDYSNQTRNGQKSPEDFKNIESSNVLQFILEPEGKLTIRPSGTEPKVKLYASLRSREEAKNAAEIPALKERLSREVAEIIQNFLKETGLSGS